MKIFNWISKTDPQKAFDTISSGVDKLFFTQEEKSDATQKAWTEWVEWYKLNNDENSIRSITRRVLAVMFAAVFLLLLLASAGFYYFVPEYAKFLFELANSLFPLVSGIMLFYFGYYGVKSVMSAKKTSNKHEKN